MNDTLYVHVNTTRVLSNTEYIFTDKLKGIFKINFSEKGSNKRSFEEQAYIYFIDFIDECEGTLHVHIYERIAMIRIITLYYYCSWRS